MAATNTGNQYIPRQTLPQPQVPSTYQPDPKNSTRRIPVVRFFGVLSLITALLLFCLGIAAIGIEAKDSYVGSAIWTALLFLLPTGVLGLLSYWKTNTCSKTTYLVMNLLSCLMCAYLVIHESFNALSEESWYRVWICLPQPGYHYFDYIYNANSSRWEYDYDGFDCPFSPQARMAVDLLILGIAFVHFVVSIISLAFTCYGTCWCCYSCCRGTPPPAVVQYTPQNGTCQLVSVGGYQTPAGFQQVSLMVPAAQPAQPGQVTSPATFPVAPGQFQQQAVLIPNSQTQMMAMPQNQMTAIPQNKTMAMPQNQTMAMPQSQMMMIPQTQLTVMPPNQMTAMPLNQVTPIPQQFFTDQGHVIPQPNPPATSEQAINAVNGKLDETGNSGQEPNEVAYGSTTTGQFHDKRNLLESV